jgi:hypothetical protein
MKRRVVLVLVLGALGPGALQAQRSEEAVQRIEAAQARVVGAGIPVELLIAKVAEGRAKGVPEARLAAVVERRSEGLIRAQQALAGSGRTIGGAEIAAGADAIEAGVAPNSLRAVIEQARDEDMAIALAVLGELVSQGVPAAQAEGRVAEALQRGGDALASLPQEAIDARERRGAPDATGRASGVGRSAGAGSAPAGAPTGVPTAGTRPAAGPPAGAPGRPAGRP